MEPQSSNESTTDETKPICPTSMVAFGVTAFVLVALCFSQQIISLHSDSSIAQHLTIVSERDDMMVHIAIWMTLMACILATPTNRSTPGKQRGIAPGMSIIALLAIWSCISLVGGYTNPQCSGAASMILFIFQGWALHRMYQRSSATSPTPEGNDTDASPEDFEYKLMIV